MLCRSIALKVSRPDSIERNTFSSFFISAAVCSGLLATNGLFGIGAVGDSRCRSTKLGVNGNTIQKLTLVLSLLVRPR